ncbi:MAG TPA: DUF4446 family protein [Clostridia bacterium]|nr:DUF4446 family protein [Clostridia bacterium]
METSLLIFTLLIFAWLGAITFLLVRILLTFGRLTKGASDKDLKSLLDEILSTIKKGEKINGELAKKLEELRLGGLSSIQKVGLIRYNPFSETGGNQSFVLALLDGNNSGFVITSLHSRESTRVFAKPVSRGKEKGFEFSKEEVQAIAEAQKEEKTGK